MKIISLFSGAGLFDAALINAGNEILLQCEKEPVQLKILQATFPSIPKHSDIMTLSKEVFNYYGIDTKSCAFVGGAPCQKHSHANPRRSEQLESKLLAQLVRLTYYCRPRFVLVENVYGFLDDPNGATWLSSRMAKIGYFGQILCFPAQALGAPHQRYRIFALYCRDKLLPNSYSQLRYMGEFATHKISQTITPGIWHGRFVAQPGIRRVAYGFGCVPKSVKKYSEIVGNGVVYDVGFFIGKSLKILNDYFYDSPEGQHLKKLPYNPF